MARPHGQAATPQRGQVVDASAVSTKAVAHEPCAQHRTAVDDAVSRLRELLARDATVALACDASAEGIIGAVGLTYLAHGTAERLRLVERGDAQCQLGETLLEAPDDTDGDFVELARRVFRGYVRKVTSGCTLLRAGRCPAGCGAACARKLVLAASSCERDAPELIHRYMRLAFARGGQTRTLVTDARALEVDRIARLTLNECEHTRQFVRFSELGDGSLFATFRPRANTIPLVASHFARRMGGERFLIVDPNHLVAAVHDPRRSRGGCAIVRLDRAVAGELATSQSLSEDEPYVRTLWRSFYDGLSLPGRDPSQRGYDLRAHWMPKRFWENLTELDAAAGRPAQVPARYAGSAAIGAAASR